LLIRNIGLYCSTFLALILTSTSLQAAAVGPGVCDIQVDKQLGVYQVRVGHKVYRGKGFLTYQGALALRNVLLSTVTCKKVSKPRTCKIKTLAAFHYAIFRGGENFDRYAKLRSLEQAQVYARDLVDKKLCLMGR
jgi:hypothetical protein